MLRALFGPRVLYWSADIQYGSHVKHRRCLATIAHADGIWYRGTGTWSYDIVTWSASDWRDRIQNCHIIRPKKYTRPWGLGTRLAHLGHPESTDCARGSGFDGMEQWNGMEWWNGTEVWNSGMTMPIERA